MAFSAVLLRRAGSYARPLAVRALGTRQNYCSVLLRPLAQGLGRSTSSSREVLGGGHGSHGSFPARPFSSLAKKQSSDASLLQVIDSEIKCAEESDDHNLETDTPDRFPFKIQDTTGTTTITLTRDYHGENIKVVVSMPDLVTGDNDDEDNDNERDDEERGGQSSIPLIVNVSKGDGPNLEFCCTAYPDEVSIDSMSVKEVGELDEDLAYEGPDFSDLDENLQKAFHKYLEIRGISPSTTNFLHEYMINKDSQEYLLWLKNLKKFVSK